MSEKKEQFKELPLIGKVIGTALTILAFVIFILDRAVSPLFFYKDYPNFIEWVKQGKIPESIVRIMIFIIPILIFKIFF